MDQQIGFIIASIRHTRVIIEFFIGLAALLVSIRLMAWDRAEKTNRSRYTLALLLTYAAKSIIGALALIGALLANAEALSLFSQILLFIGDTLAACGMGALTLYLFGIVNGIIRPALSVPKTRTEQDALMAGLQSLIAQVRAANLIPAYEPEFMKGLSLHADKGPKQDHPQPDKPHQGSPQ